MSLNESDTGDTAPMVISDTIMIRPDIDITEKHKQVSYVNTPKSFIKSKMGMDYVEYSYMRDIADKYYPGWSWEVLKSEALSDFAYVVHGRLKWYDGGIWRTGDTIAAHRIQKNRGSDEYVDIGNDVKSANTDCIKKAFNMYLNIADDVYRNRVEDVSLTDKEVGILNLEMEGLSDEWRAKISNSIEKGEIEKSNLQTIIKRIQLIKESEG